MSSALEQRTTADLIYLLQRQYPQGVTTFAPCPKCGQGARGGAHCSDCLCNELERRGAQPIVVNRLCTLLEERRDVGHRIEDMIDQIGKRIDQMKKWETKVEGEDG